MKKQILLLSLLLALTAVLTIGCVYEYKHHQNVTNTAVLKAQAQRNSAITEVKQHDSANALNLRATQGQLQSMTNEKTALCVQIKTAKLISPYCP